MWLIESIALCRVSHDFKKPLMVLQDDVCRLCSSRGFDIRFRGDVLDHSLLAESLNWLLLDRADNVSCLWGFTVPGLQCRISVLIQVCFGSYLLCWKLGLLLNATCRLG